MELASSSAVVAFPLKAASTWWNDVNESSLWQDRIFHLLAALYGIVAAVAFIQLVRIQLRVPEYGWTTQKVFHFLNFLVNAGLSVRFSMLSVVFGFGFGFYVDCLVAQLDV